MRSQRKEYTVRMPGMSPILERGGATRWAGELARDSLPHAALTYVPGEDLGASTSEVLQGAGYSEAEIDKLRTDGII